MTRKIILFLCILTWGRVLYAASSLTLLPASSLWLTGTSTLHPYASTSTLTHVVADLTSGNGVEATAPAGAVLSDIASRAPFQKFELMVPVKGLKSGESGLDKNMYKALKATDAPEIRFVLNHYDATASGAEGPLSFKAAGQLSIAGVQKDVVLTGSAQAKAEGLTMEGQYELRMSDYGIKPPTLLLGAINVADPVVIHFRLLFQLSPA